MTFSSDGITTGTSKLVLYSADVCVDCYMTGHGVFEGESNINELGYEFMSFLRHADGYTDFACEDDNVPHFSWLMCDGCLSRLAGDRFTVEVMQKVRV